MKLLIFSCAILFNLIFFNSAHANAVPDPKNTPGVLCTPTDPNFSGYDYPEHIARCNRNIGTPEKLKVAASYGNIPQSEWTQYEFDHMIPLCAGGSDDLRNLWPQPIAEAHQKDVLENNICLAMKAGTMKQAQAVQKVRDWFKGQALANNSKFINTAQNDLASITCRTKDSTVINFKLAGNDQISNVSISLVDRDGEHEVVKVGEVISGREIKKVKSPLLKGFKRYELNEKAKDHFEIFLPENVGADNAKFGGFFKIGFEDNYPNLVPFTCD